MCPLHARKPAGFLRSFHVIANTAAIAVLVLLAGCGGGGQSVIGGSPTGTQTLDAGQTLALTATVVNDIGLAGVNWTITGAGTVGGANKTSSAGSTVNTITYTAPASVSSTETATVTATSIHTPSQSVSFNIIVNTALAFTSPTTLPSGTVGTAYATQLVASGGTGELTYALVSGTLPPGLLISASGKFSGTPTAYGTYTFVAQVKDQATTPDVATQTFTITINPAQPIITTTTLPNATINVAYSQQLAFTGGTGTGTFAITAGSLPASSGLTLSASGLISGTPPAAAANQTYSFSVTVTSGSQTSAPVAYTIFVINPLSISPTTLPAGATSVAYSYQLQASGGSGSGYTFAFVSGTLPSGLASLPPNGDLQFTPTTAGTYSFVVKLTDSQGNTANFTLSLTIGASTLVITTTSLPAGTINVPYSQQLTYSGGPGGTPTFAIASGSLSGSGLTLSTNGVISGTPTNSGTYTFSVTVTVGGTTSAAKSLSITISNLTFTSGTSASGEVGLAFDFPEGVKGGTPPYSWSVTQGTLPAGLTISSTTGLISGTPTGTATTTDVTITVTDAASNTASQVVAVTINPARTSVNNALLNGQYAFLVNGFDASGNPLAMTGEFDADGNGNITGGETDTNGTALTTPALNVTLTAATYVVGSDNRGKLTLTTSSGSQTFVLVLNQVSGGIAAGGFLTEFDASGQSLSGTLALQNPAALSTAALTGGYAFGMAGFETSAATHAGLIGELQFASSAIASGEVIETTLGVGPVTLSTPTYSVSSKGRITMDLELSGPNIHLVGYVVSANQFYLLSSAMPAATAPLLSGVALSQTTTTGNFALSTLNGNAVGSVERVVPATTGTGNDAEIAVGLYGFNGTGTATLADDQNTAGVITSNSLSGPYTVAANGRAAFTLSSGLGGCENCASGQTFAYLTGTNQGFTLDFFGGNGTGYFTTQTQSSFTSASFNGSYALGTTKPVVPGPVSTAGVTSNSTVDATFDTNDLGALSPDVALSFSAAVAANGRVVLQGSDGSSYVLYLASPAHGLLLDTSTSAPATQELTQ